MARSCGSLAAGPGLRLPLAEIGAEGLFQAVAARFGPPSGLPIIRLPASGHDQAYTGAAFRVKCEGPSLHGLGRYGRVRATKGGRNAGLRRMFSWLSRRRSSVVERVIGNDEVLSSILSGGTI
jgi:hypothetical protein